MGMITKKSVVIAIGCLILLQIFVHMTRTRKKRERFVPSSMNFSHINTLVYMKPTDSDELYNGIETVEEIIAGDRNIFFLETAHIKKSQEINLKVRQGCAVESAALMNPTMKVYLFIFTDKFWIYSNKTRTILTQLSRYENINIRHVHLETYFKNSPMDEWWNTTNSLSSTYHFVHHMSDILRYFTLWRFSGIYLDLDVVVTSSLENLEDFTAAEDSTNVAAGVLGFHLTDVGRRFSNACLFEIMTDFRGDVWAYNGPGVITRTLKNICGTNMVCEMNPDRCDGFTVFPAAMFYPISPGTWERYFDSIDKHKTMRKVNNAYAIHVWNNQSQSTVVKVGSEVPYDLIAAKYCPRNHKTCGDTF